jgi:Fe-S cluster biogenesis protein NfuA
MEPGSELQNKIQRIGTIVGQLESAGDPNFRALAKELLESLMALHGAGLERILELARAGGKAGDDFVQKCGRDELVSCLLLLYGLHPDELATRVERGLEKSRSFLESHAAQATLKTIGEDGTITVQLIRRPNGGCGSTAEAVRAALEANLQNAAPDAPAILIEETGMGASGTGFVSLAQLQGGHSMAALSAARTQRSGD